MLSILPQTSGGTMQDKYAQMQRFFIACDELISGKYILADNKISEVLKAIAASEELTGLFTAVTERFDYPAAKQKYLRYPSEPGGTKGAAYLPAERGDLIAFIFCLLVDFDTKVMRLQDFLRKFFHEDGSFTASYTLFVERMIRPFRDIVRDCFPELARPGSVSREREEALDKIGEIINLERGRMLRATLNPVDADACTLILDELYAAAGRRDTAELKALLCGYSYFLNTVGYLNDESRALFELSAKL